MRLACGELGGAQLMSGAHPGGRNGQCVQSPDGDIALLAELPALRAHGVRQPEIIRTGAGNLVGPNGYFLQEFLAGEPELYPTSTQVRAVMRGGRRPARRAQPAASRL